jgi:filamentous hemagglutinin family protein
MKKLCYSLLVCLQMCKLLEALPQGSTLISGEAHLHTPRPQHLTIEVSDKAILHYQSFHIAEGESVRFIQPSSSSSVLNRIVGEDPSRILGHLSANGRVFLINPHGMCFGPQATINTASFLASTLNIANDDFLNDRLIFSLEKGSEKASIVNQGHLTASPEGFIALLAPVVHNQGMITAKAGNVLIAAANKVTLDFSGDGLMQFTVEGDLKEALIENAGSIQAAEGKIHLSMKMAHQALKMVVNTEGLSQATTIEEINGMIRLVDTSVLLADNVSVEGGANSQLHVAGVIDTSKKASSLQGGSIEILGDTITLQGASLDASGDFGGGEILIGGNYQGKGIQHNAKRTLVDNNTRILSDAYTEGDGGRVIIWSDDTTLFNGQVSAQGGSIRGNGGFVETSGKQHLGVNVGHVTTFAPQGHIGEWLLDPATVNIVTGGNATLPQVADCSTTSSLSIDPTTLAAANSAVTICCDQVPDGSITVSNGVSMGANASLTLNAGSTGFIRLNNNISTIDQPLIFTGHVYLGADVTLQTSSSTGGAITFNNAVDSISSGNNHSLTLIAGTGAITFDAAVGSTTPLTKLDFGSTTGLVTISTAIVLTGANPLTFPSPISLANNSAITNHGTTSQSISFSDTLNGAFFLTLDVGISTVLFSGTVGDTTPLTNLTFSNTPSSITIDNNITLTGENPLTFPGAVVLGGDATLDTHLNNGTITFNSTINGNHALTLLSGSGLITFKDNVGNTTPLTGLSFTDGSTSSTAISLAKDISLQGSSTLTLPIVTLSNVTGITSHLSNASGTVTLHGAITTSAAGDGLNVLATAINIGAGITTQGGTITMQGPVTLTSSSITLNTTFGGVTQGGVISFSDAITTTATTSLILSAGTAHSITFGGDVGTSLSPLNSLSLSAASSISVGGDFFVNGGLSFPASVTLTSDSTITTSNTAITFTNTVNGAHALILTSGTGNVSFQNSVGNTAPLTNLAFTGTTGNILLQSNVTLTGANPLAFPNPLSFDTSSITILNPSNTVTFSNTVTGTGSTFGLTVSGSSIHIANDITTKGGLITMQAPVALTGSSVTLNTTAGSFATGAAISFSGAITTTAATSLTLNSGTTGSMIFGGAVGTSLNPLSNLTFSAGVPSASVKGDMHVDGGLSFPGITLTADSTMTTSNAAISFKSISGSFNLTLVAGTGAVSFSGNVGSSSSPLTSLNFTSAGSINIGTASSSILLNITNAIVFPASTPITLDGDSVSITSAHDVTFNSSIDGTTAGSTSLSVVVNLTGVITLPVIGATTALGDVSITARTAYINNITTRAGSIAIGTSSGGGGISGGGLIYLLSSSFDTTDSGASSTGARISFFGNINSPSGTPSSLSLTTGSPVVLNGGTGSQYPLDTISFSSGVAEIDIAGDFILTGNQDLTFPAAVVTIPTGASITNSNKSIIFDQACIGPSSLELNAQSIILAAVDISGSLSITGTGSSPLLTLGADIVAGSLLFSSIDVAASTSINITTDHGSFTSTGCPIAISALLTITCSGGNAYLGSVSAAALIVKADSISLYDLITIGSSGGIIESQSGSVLNQGGSILVSGDFGVGARGGNVASSSTPLSISFVSGTTATLQTGAGQKYRCSVVYLTVDDTNSLITTEIPAEAKGSNVYINGILIQKCIPPLVPGEGRSRNGVYWRGPLTSQSRM